MVKALWLIISPLSYFITKRPLSSHWAFCQVSGFFLAASIEASDIAVLLISIHTVLFIVKGRHTGTNFGLQPYRRVAYTFWATVPIILAAIVPITGDSFVDSGPFCYLPIEPNWYRISLAWTPRYVIFAFIIVTYTALYLYVHVRFRRFGRDQRSASNSDSVSAGPPMYQHSKRRWGSRSVPPTPDLASHGLFNSAHASMSTSPPPKFRQYSDASTESTLKMSDGTNLPNVPEQAARRNSIAWKLVNFEHDARITTPGVSPHTDVLPHEPTTGLPSPGFDEIANNSNTLVDTAVVTSIPTPEPAHTTGNSDVETSSRVRRGGRPNRWQQRSRTRSSDTSSGNSLTRIMAGLLQWPSRPAMTAMRTGDEEAGTAGEEEEDEEPIFTGSSSAHLPTDESAIAMQRSRERMKRQMRLLFVYPVIYLLTWVAPFVAHAYRYDSAFRKAVRIIDTDTTFATAAQNGPTTATSASIAVIATHHILVAATTASSSPSSSSSIISAPIALPFEPLGLRIAAVISISISAAVNCAFFTAWERPWRHLRGGFWENLAKRFRFYRVCGRNSRGFTGRSRDERFVDERVARMRREREKEIGIELRATMSAGGPRNSSSTAGGRSAQGEGGVVAGGGGDVRSGGRSDSDGDGEGECSGGKSSGNRRREWWDALDDEAL